MKKLFLPAESLMNRLSYPVKFAAIGLLVFLAFASLMLALADQLNRTIERSENELTASTLSKPLFELVESSQRHRGLSSMLLSGNAAAAQRRASLQQEIDEALASMARRLPEAERGLREWQAIGVMWEDIRGNGLDWPQARNTQAHTALVERLLSFQTQLADAYGLTFDPEPQTYYLINAATDRMPYLLERIGRLRASASAVLAQGRMDDAQRTTLIVLSDEIRAGLGSIEDSIEKVVRMRPELRAQLGEAVRALHERSERIGKVVEGIVQRGDFSSTTDDEFFGMTTETIELGYRQMYEVLLPTLDMLLEQRIVGARQILTWNFAVLLLAVAVMAAASLPPATSPPVSNSRRVTNCGMWPAASTRWPTPCAG